MSMVRRWHSANGHEAIPLTRGSRFPVVHPALRPGNRIARARSTWPDPAISGRLLDSRQPSFNEVSMRRIRLAGVVVLALGITVALMARTLGVAPAFSPPAADAAPARKVPVIGYLASEARSPF